MAIAKGCLPLETFLRLPEQEPPLEYEDGRLTQKMSPQIEHSVIQGWLVEQINAFGRSRKLAVAFSELRVRFSGRSVVPDISVFRWDRLPVTPTGRAAGPVTSAPDIVVEITSPGQAPAALAAKCRRYAERGVPISLLINYRREVARIFRPGNPEQVLRGDDRIDLDEVLPGFELTAGEIFGALQLR